MSQNPTQMLGTETFKPKSLAREIRRRGLTPESFADLAKINRNTIHRALKGEPVRPSTFGKIIVCLGATPVIDVPDDLVKAS